MEPARNLGGLQVQVPPWSGFFFDLKFSSCPIYTPFDPPTALGNHILHAQLPSVNAPQCQTGKSNNKNIHVCLRVCVCGATFDWLYRSNAKINLVLMLLQKLINFT